MWHQNQCNSTATTIANTNTNKMVALVKSGKHSWSQLTRKRSNNERKNDIIKMQCQRKGQKKRRTKWKYIIYSNSLSFWALFIWLRKVIAKRTNFFGIVLMWCHTRHRVNSSTTYLKKLNRLFLSSCLHSLTLFGSIVCAIFYCSVCLWWSWWFLFSIAQLWMGTRCLSLDVAACI